MRTNDRRHRIWRRLVVGALALAIMLTIGTALTAVAGVPSTTAHQFSSHPMISGTVVTVNDHQMVVDTDQGERVTLGLDWRTMAPRDLGPGMVMRTEFLALEDCRFYAQRIMPLRAGMATGRLQLYANTRDSREAIAHSAAASGGYRGEQGESQVRSEGRESLPLTVGEHAFSPVMTATPTTAGYQFSTRPMISGRVVSVNDHRLVVQTDQGQRVALVMDSRTMVPGAIAPGDDMRAEFMQLKDGRYYAKRVSRIGTEVADREQAYAHTRDSDVVIAQNSSDCGFVSAAPQDAPSFAAERREIVELEPVVQRGDPASMVETPETLPQTASNQSLILLLGLIALVSAGLVSALPWARDRLIAHRFRGSTGRSGS